MAAPNKNMAQILDNEQFIKIGCSVPESTSVPVRVRPCWQDVTLTDLEPDNGLLVTHVNQTKDLLRVQGKAQSHDRQTSVEWLNNHSLQSMKLTIEDLINQGDIVVSTDDKATKHVEFSSDIVHDFESRLCHIIELYHQRIEWLMKDSRKIFGLITGNKVGVLIDTSDINRGPGRLDFQQELLCLIDEQLCYKKQLYFLSFGTDSSWLWEHARDVKVRTLQEARQWTQEMKPNGGCNLLKAIKKIITIKGLDSLVIVVGSCPDQTSEVLSDYIQQCMLGRNLLIHVVAYECSHPGSRATLKNLAETVGGRYHSYSSSSEEQLYTGSDVQLLLYECQKARDVLSKIKEMEQGTLDDALSNIMQEISTEVAKLPPVRFLPQPPNHEGPLSIAIPGFLPKTSAEWLQKNGLKAKKLSLYQVLAPNAFSFVEEFVPILQKIVSSTLHEKAMMQFEWHDGSIKNVHVDPPILYEYQKELAKTVRMYEKRINWLSSGSRRIWGTVCEQRVVILVDLSITNSMYIIHIQHSLRLLFEEQISNKDFFNVIAFGSDIMPWKPEMVPSAPENLQNAWKWVLSLQCGGSRNVLAALKRAVEVDFKDKDQHESQGLYLFTSGVPDQEMHTVDAYVAEVCGGCSLQLHVCLFTITSFDSDGSVPPRYASVKDTASCLKQIARAAHGRFHWFEETGIIESDDINAILSEMEKAVNYSKKCACLVESLKQRCGGQAEQSFQEDERQMHFKRQKDRQQKLSSPKPTALTLARMNIKEDQHGEKKHAMRALMWRPNSAKAIIPAAQPVKEWFQTGEVKPKKQPKTSFSVFYTDKGKSVGAVFKKYPKMKTVRKSIPFVTLPKEEEICSTKEWLKMYSLKKLKLELPRLMFGPDCNHQKKTVQSLNKKVSAKYCTIFPSVEVNGAVKHLQFQPKELEEYIEQTEKVLRRYIQRMQWLLSGSRRLFGTILESKVCILLDTSGSMDPYLLEVKRELTSLMWEQLKTNCDSFNLITFADNVAAWRECLAEASDDACHDAVQWVSYVQAHGNTCILQAVQKAFQQQDVQGLYLLTDGKPDTSCHLVLKEVERLVKDRSVAVHTISFNCSDRTANEFLKKLAWQTGGRYHRCHGDVDGHFVAHRMLTEGFTDEDDPVLPLFEGDDLKKLTKEITKARRFLTQARSFRLLLLEKQMKLHPKDISFEGSDLSGQANMITAENDPR
ncbi:von Willebrand factor A domain-containing protein 3A [Rhinatrema bivittatum]|uniref:von Willebrand factor A domain-containing protein 3A n=1 Tax=Rhinatrema bivittatum TaxID=194408 RepID=UPI00112C6AB1|nr:von Willebrand factor A domain-containing protein 3A [Rhinatrema bivittatum]XP_029432933.1 von Willebrand factor A domain-containing protein 3A [Rhinatrema bivittatum]